MILISEFSALEEYLSPVKYFVETMASIEDLAQKLFNVRHEDTNYELQVLLCQLVEIVNTPGDITCLIGPVLKLLPSRNMSIKKTAYSVLPRICCHHVDISLLVVNTIIQDSKDPNPLIRSMAIIALGCLPALHQDYASKILHAALNDNNPKVRCTAVNTCKKVFENSPNVIQEEGLIDRLYVCVKDKDPVVVTDSFLALDTILAAEGGVIVNRNIAFHLLHRLTDFKPQHLATVMQVLKKYKPENEEELFQELSILDQYLVHPSSSAVLVNCITLFLSFTEEKYPNLEKDIIKRVMPVLKNHLTTKTSRESSLYILKFLLSITERDSDWFLGFEDSPNLFYPKEDGCDYVLAEKKLQMISHICTENNFTEILEKLKNSYCCHPKLHKESIKCLYFISKKIPSVSCECINTLISVLDYSNREITECVLNILQNFTFDNYDISLIGLLLKKVILVTDIKLSNVPHILPILIGEFGEVNDNVPYILELLAENFDIYESEDFKNLVLVAALKMFLKMPGVYQHILGEIMEKCVKSDKTSILRSRSIKYYTLLKHNFELVKKILL